MVAVRQKPPELLANRRGGRGRGLLVAVVPLAERRMLPMPRGLGTMARKRWRAFWRSPVSMAVDLDADQERLHHWIESVDERARLWPLLKAEPVIEGKRGAVTNPLQRRIRELTMDIEKAEEAFGMTPLSRFRLQLTYTEAGSSAMKLQRAQEKDERRRAEVIDLDA